MSIKYRVRAWTRTMRERHGETVTRIKSDAGIIALGVLAGPIDPELWSSLYEAVGTLIRKLFLLVLRILMVFTFPLSWLFLLLLVAHIRRRNKERAAAFDKECSDF